MTCKQCERELSTQEQASFAPLCEDCWAGQSLVGGLGTARGPEAVKRHKTDKGHEHLSSRNYTVLDKD